MGIASAVSGAFPFGSRDSRFVRIISGGLGDRRSPLRRLAQGDTPGCHCGFGRWWATLRGWRQVLRFLMVPAPTAARWRCQGDGF